MANGETTEGWVACLFPLDEAIIRDVLTPHSINVWQVADSEKRSEADLQRLRDARVIIARVRDIDEKTLAACKNLELLYIISAGVQGLPFETLRRRGIAVANVGDISASAISEYVLGAMLLFSARFLFSINNQRKKHWQRYQTTQSLAGKRLLVAGAGKIGQAVAAKAKSFAMETVGIRQTPAPTPHFDSVATLDAMPSLLGGCDFVVCTLPLTNATEGLFGRQTFLCMRPDAVFINVSRGSILVQDDLIWALENKKLAGAVLDVFEKEPLPAQSPLWECENVVITPHSSGRTEQFMYAAVSAFVPNLKAHLAGLPLPGKVNLDKHY